jgi:transposase
MGTLADRVDHVIGVDTHRDSHSVAVCSPNGAVTAEATVAADAFGYKRLLRFAGEQAHGRRVWAIEGTGSFGAGLTTFLLEQGEWVVEVDRPARPARRNGAKSDELDAARAACEALSRQHLAPPIPASSGRLVRHRLNRGGDRQLNRALHTIVLSRLAHHAETKRYAARRTTEGKTPREIKRCLKRHLARRLFRLLETNIEAA